MLEAMESSVNGGFSQHLQSFGDSSEEELSVLPRHTKVVVTGNNRTKSVLVGLRGVVKKAVGLGGWHWLVIFLINFSFFFFFCYSNFVLNMFFYLCFCWYSSLRNNTKQCVFFLFAFFFNACKVIFLSLQ
jgi:hypothetical protein